MVPLVTKILQMSQYWKEKLSTNKNWSTGRLWRKTPRILQVGRISCSLSNKRYVINLTYPLFVKHFHVEVFVSWTSFALNVIIKVGRWFSLFRVILAFTWKKPCKSSFVEPTVWGGLYFLLLFQPALCFHNLFELGVR